MIVQTVSDSRQTLWLEVTRAVRAQWGAVDEAERDWAVEKIEQLTELQQKLHSLVAAADGEAVCQKCRGGCCGDGLYHPTLVTILAHLIIDEPLPTPDFSRSCPYLGKAGCLFRPAVRPFNCIIFICEKIAARCSEEQQLSLSRLEAEIRTIYEAFDQRYLGSSLRGLMNRPAATDLLGLFSRR